MISCNLSALNTETTLSQVKANGEACQSVSPPYDPFDYLFHSKDITK